MHSIGRDYNASHCQESIAIAKSIETLTLDTSMPKGLLELAATDEGILAFCESLAQRRTTKKLQTTAYFTDKDHIVSLCGSMSEENHRFVQEVVHNPHFLGRLWKQDVESILTGQKPLAGILYIEEEWVQIDLTNSCSPKTLYAKLFFSHVLADGHITDCCLTPGDRVEEVCNKHGAHFLEVDQNLKRNAFFSGFSTSNLLQMQSLAVPIATQNLDAKKINDLSKNIYATCTSITREELDAVLEEDMRKYRRTDRYNNVLPYAINCVTTGIEGQDINGSYIRSGNRVFIACQGPSDKTIDAFWQAVVHHGTLAVIALGPTTERQTEKFSDRYFIFDQPLTLTDGTRVEKTGIDTAIDWQFSIKARNKPDKILNHCIITRTFTLTSPNGTTTSVKHLHCPSWQDMMGGDPRVLTELINCIRATPDPHLPIVVHCSAGLGRTGTLIAGYDMHHQLTTSPEKPISLAATIMQHRHQRYGVVQSQEQIEMLLAYLAQQIL